jgi:thiamine-phosphate pyrophosphorylase
MRDWRDFRLYVVTDPVIGKGRSHAAQAAAAAAGGAGLVQVRDKRKPPREALPALREAAEALAPSGVPLVANDWPWSAREARAAGVHLGQDDLPVAHARALVPGLFVGKSTHSLDQALRAEDEGPDYIAVGPVFPTATKRRGSPSLGLKALEAVAARLSGIWVAIGGITLDNLEQVLDAGAGRVAVVSAVVGAENPEAACRAFVRRLGKAGV